MPLEVTGEVRGAKAAMSDEPEADDEYGGEAIPLLVFRPRSHPHVGVGRVWNPE